ncbi:MAG: CRISPR-associated endonuclease Cas2 [Planctomycetes bacterium]|nr:CRISPR-associated endonuclease Cas2 [Planctomycetota bacterium]
MCYDIPDDSKRAKLARWLDGFGDRIQDSVFEADLDQDLLDEMWGGVQRLVDASEDLVALVPICAACGGKRRWLGGGRRLEDKLGAVVWVV